jgi:S-adenosylmethionine:tRNA ribosyltransferase-isomerase
MLCLNEREVVHGEVRDFASHLREHDLLVINETKVRKARLLCHRPHLSPGAGGGKVELLFLHEVEPQVWAALGKANRPLRPGDQLFAVDLKLKVERRDDDGTLAIRVEGDLDGALLAGGSMPIPPYMDRASDADDDERYQTVFAQALGSAAAPTAGLHLTERMLDEAKARGVRLSKVVLHVGVGTFRPVSTDDLDQHLMHSEQVCVSSSTCQAVLETRRAGGRVVAVGTTVVRALESARDPACEGLVLPSELSTRLLIQPGYRFSVVDALLTNFHQPKSTLLALVSAFAGYERVFAAYREAVAHRYRFLSYGDAMWIPSCYARKTS